MQIHNSLFFLCIVHKMLYNIIVMEIKVIRSKRHSISIKINENGEVFVRCPLKYPKDELLKIINNKRQWIEKCVNDVSNKKLQNKDYYMFNKILLNGKSYDIKKVDKTLIIGANILKIKGNDVKKTLICWLKKQAQTLLFKRLDQVSNFVGKDYTQATLMTARKKWGSCDNRKNIKLNYRLVMLDNKYIDYVCLHELTHTKYMNHSKLFWNEVSKFMPNWKQIKTEMSNFNFVLEIY